MPEAVPALTGIWKIDPLKTDRGILAILDDRIWRMRYGKIFLESLPEYATTQDIDEVARFMENAPTSGTDCNPLSGLRLKGSQAHMYEMSVDEEFAAAHNLRNYKGKCEDLHGHNYKVRVTVAGPELDSVGFALRFRAGEEGNSGRDSHARS